MRDLREATFLLSRYLGPSQVHVNGLKSSPDLSLRATLNLWNVDVSVQVSHTWFVPVFPAKLCLWRLADTNFSPGSRFIDAVKGGFTVVYTCRSPLSSVILIVVLSAESCIIYI